MNYHAEGDRINFNQNVPLATVPSTVWDTDALSFVIRQEITQRNVARSFLKLSGLPTVECRE
jgi:hypothetical protein